MATTKIWTIKGNARAAIPKVIDYVKNPQKTTTEKGILTSGINCDIHTATADFFRTKTHYGKMDGILCWHGYQSFKGHEVSPEVAHQIGVLMAQELWGDRFEVVVGTHLDGNNIHNHFVVNSVSFADGLKFYGSKETYQQMRDVSDRLCKEFDLSYLPRNPENSSSKHYGEYDAEKNGRPTVRGMIRKDVDAAIAKATSWEAFLNELRSAGYEIDLSGKYAKVRPPGHEKFFRLYKLGERYTPEEIRRRIAEPKLSSARRKMRFPGRTSQKQKKATGFKALYFYYCYRLGVFQSKRKPRYTSAAAKRNVREIAKMMQDYRFLQRTGITTEAELNAHKAIAEQQYEQLTKQLQQLKQSSGAAQAAAQMQEQRKLFADELKMCMRIEQRSKRIKEQLQEMRKEQAYGRNRSRSRTGTNHFENHL